MRNPFRSDMVVTALVIALGFAAHSAQSSSAITTTADAICITSNGLPDHPTGTFPNPNNPHSLTEQAVKVCVTKAPQKGDTPQAVRVTGIATNGVIIRPGTADYYDASVPRGHSRDRSSGWNLDGMGARDLLGLDAQNAHVDNRGLYHYHGMPPALVTADDTTLMGYAADGFEIHYAGDTARPSYLLKSGLRPTAPGGAYDGTYNEDFEYVRGAGNLDECNGAEVQGRYVYFATDAYPFYPRCLWGTEITRMR